MEKISKKLIKEVWNKYTKCRLYIDAATKTETKYANDDLMSYSKFYLEYVESILRCLKKADCKVLVAEYVNLTGNDNTYTRSGWYAKLRRANGAFFKYFDKKSLKTAKKKKHDK